MQIKFREYSQLTAEERRDGIEAAQHWLRGAFPLLLPCDITEQCRQQIIGEAGQAEQRRDMMINKELFG